MNKEQFNRWQDFSLRMARTCYHTSRRPSGAWIVERVEFVFDCIDDDERELIVSWDGNSDDSMPLTDHMKEMFDDSGPMGRCDSLEQEELAWEQFDNQWSGPIHCCVRAGLDMAVAPSAGVLGFTAGDLRNMYPEGVPDWVTLPGENWRYWLSDEENCTFAEMPDEAVLCL